MKRRRRLWVLSAATGCVLLAGAAWMISAPRPAFGEAEAARFEHGSAERGRLVFLAADCGSCHASPGQGDSLRLGGGMLLPAPVGQFRPPNISPDPVDGIGRWRGLDLANALMSGVSPDRRHYYPALPYVAYAGMQPEDVGDLMAYLRTLPPVQGRAPSHEIPFPLNIRRSLGFWKLLFFDRRQIPPQDRGRYLVEALGHCAECHSSRNLLGGVRQETRYAGGPDQEGTGFVPNITAARIGHWRREDMVRLLTTGHTPDGRRVMSGMDDVVRNTAQLPIEDRGAMAEYILSLPARPTP